MAYNICKRYISCYKIKSYKVILKILLNSPYKKFTLTIKILSVKIACITFGVSIILLFFRPRRYIRPDFYTVMREKEFKERFRFSKQNARRLTDLVRGSLEREEGGKGLPLSPDQTVLLGLDILAGGHFMRTQGELTGCCKATAFNHLYRSIFS